MFWATGRALRSRRQSRTPTNAAIPVAFTDGCPPFISLPAPRIAIGNASAVRAWRAVLLAGAASSIRISGQPGRPCQDSVRCICIAESRAVYAFCPRRGPLLDWVPITIGMRKLPHRSPRILSTRFYHKTPIWTPISIFTVHLNIPNFSRVFFLNSFQ